MRCLYKLYESLDLFWHRLYTSIDPIVFRTTKKFHVIKIRTLTPNYYDKDTQLLHGMMQLLVDFVEIELASYKIEQMRGVKPFLYKHLPWFLRSSEWIRSPELGLLHLREECEFLGDTTNINQLEGEIVQRQIDASKTLMKIYLWWKNVYPNRPTPEDASGWTECYKELKLSNSLLPENDGNQQDIEDFAKTQMAKYRECLDSSFDIEKKYIEEENEMLLELVKVRGFLWT